MGASEEGLLGELCSHSIHYSQLYGTDQRVEDLWERSGGWVSFGNSRTVLP